VRIHLHNTHSHNSDQTKQSHNQQSSLFTQSWMQSVTMLQAGWSENQGMIHTKEDISLCLRVKTRPAAF